MQAPPAARTARYRPSDEVDFVVVGSGAAGGIIARELSTAGFSVVVLEQGPRLTEQQFDHDEFGAFFRFSNVNDPATQPQTFRTTPTARTEPQIAAIYGRLVGGSNAHFTANVWRLRPSDFNEAQPARRSRRRQFRRLADRLRRSRAVLHEGGLGDRRVGRARAVRRATLAPLPDAAAAGEVVRRAHGPRRGQTGLALAAGADGDQLAVLQRAARLPALRLLPVLQVRVPGEVHLDGDDAARGGGDGPLRDPAEQLRGARRDEQRTAAPPACPTSTGPASKQFQRAKAVVLCANGAETPRAAAQLVDRRASRTGSRTPAAWWAAPDVQHLRRRERAVPRAPAQRVQERAEHAHRARLLRFGP